MTPRKKTLTNQELLEGFENSFQLVDRAIGLAHRWIAAGHPIEGTDGEWNQACQILGKIAAGDEEIPPLVEEPEESTIVTESAPVPTHDPQ